MQGRTEEDRLREEYFHLLPEISRVVEYLEAVAKYKLLSIAAELRKYEKIVVRSRAKECESAIEALRRRQEGAIFDRERSGQYSLKSLRDLAGIRVLAFPRSRLAEVDQSLKETFPAWTPGPVLDDAGGILALKYWGYCSVSQDITGEYQIVPMLTGLFWDVEHSAIYKPAPELRGVSRSAAMRERVSDVLTALRRFEEGFESLTRDAGE